MPEKSAQGREAPQDSAAATGRARLFDLMRDPAPPLVTPSEWAAAPSVTEFLSDSLKARSAPGLRNALRQGMRRLRGRG